MDTSLLANADSGGLDEVRGGGGNAQSCLSYTKSSSMQHNKHTCTWNALLRSFDREFFPHALLNHGQNGVR